MTRQTPVRVSFIVPVRNDAKRLRICLDAIASNRDPRVETEVLVADNGSTDDSREAAIAAGARVLSLPGLRVSDLRNRASAAATGDLLAFVDADHKIVPTWIASAVDVLETEGVGAVGALYSAPVPGSWVQRMYGAMRGHTSGRHDVSWLGSGNLAVRREAFDAVRGFDAALEACEDVDFCQRLRREGWRLVGDERLESVHLGDPVTLGALFRAERWRGRDNMRVSLRAPLTLRTAPSVLIPAVDVVAGALALVGVFSVPVFGLRSVWMAVGGALVITALAALQTLRIVTRAGARSPVGLAQAFLVAVTYDLARAIALVTRASHHRRPDGGSRARATTR
jgi:hypothetical protein